MHGRAEILLCHQQSMQNYSRAIARATTKALYVHHEIGKPEHRGGRIDEFLRGDLV
jgi:hypothetical protein